MTIPKPFVILQPVSEETALVMKVRSILVLEASPYQEIAIAEFTEYGRGLVLDGLVQSTEADEHIYHESLVHPPMVAHPNPRKVLIIGGGEGATLREVLKHSTVERAVMVDIDERVVDLSKRYLETMHGGSMSDPRATVLIMDGLRYIAETRERFDVVILDLTDPYGPEISRTLYSEEFYRNVSSIIGEDGIMVTQAGSSFYYPKTYDMVLENVRSVFPIVVEYNVWVPSFGYAVNFIAASRSLNPAKLTPDEVDARLSARGVTTRFYGGRTHVALMNMPIYRRLNG